MNRLLFILLILFFAVSCRENIPTAPKEETHSTIYISSSPAGAKIFLESNEIGRTTPDSIVNLRPGNYSISLKLFGYSDTTFSVGVLEGIDPRVFVRFRSN